MLSTATTLLVILGVWIGASVLLCGVWALASWRRHLDTGRTERARLAEHIATARRITPARPAEQGAPAGQGADTVPRRQPSAPPRRVHQQEPQMREQMAIGSRGPSV